jgi:hypothetical protein
MASFVEQATLKVIDESSGPLAKINAELKKLFATAAGGKNLAAGGKNAAGAYTQATVAAQKLNAVQKAGTDARLASVREVIRAQRGLVQSEQAVVKARIMGTEEIVRANRGLANFIQANERETTRVAAREQRERERTQREGVRETARIVREAARADRTTAREEVRAGNQAAKERRAARKQVISPVAGFVTGAAGLAAYNLAHEVGKLAMEGAKSMDIGESSLRLKQLDKTLGPGSEKKAREELEKLGEEKDKLPGKSFLNYGQRAQLFSETIGTTGEIEGAVKLTGALEELTRTGVALGQNFERAQENAYNYAKALDMMGRLNDQTTGKFVEGLPLDEYKKQLAEYDKQKAAGVKGLTRPKEGMIGSFEYLQKLQPEIGKEMTGNFFRQMVKYMRGTKFAVDDGAVMLMGEDMGNSAAVGYNQMVKQLGGRGQKAEKIGALHALGLIEMEDKVTGYTKRGKPKTKPFIKGVVDAELLSRDAPQWIAKYVVGKDTRGGAEPVTEAERKAGWRSQEEMQAKYKKAFGREFDTKDAADVYELASRMVGDRTAVESLMAQIYNAAEIQRKLNQVDDRSCDPKFIRDITGDSLTVGMAQFKNQFEAATGSLIKVMQPALIPGMQMASHAFEKIGEAVRKGGMPDVKDLGAAGLGVLPLAIGAGTMAMQDPKTAPIGAASLALTGSAGALTGAAGALTAAAAVQSAGGIKGLIEQLGETGAMAWLARAGLRVVPFAGPAAAAITAYQAFKGDETGTVAERERYEARSEKNRELRELYSRLDQLNKGDIPGGMLDQKQINAMKDAQRKGKPVPEDVQKVISKEQFVVATQIAKLVSEINRLSQPGATATPYPDWVEKSKNAIREQQAPAKLPLTADSILHISSMSDIQKMADKMDTVFTSVSTMASRAMAGLPKKPDQVDWGPTPPTAPVAAPPPAWPTNVGPIPPAAPSPIPDAGGDLSGTVGQFTSAIDKLSSVGSSISTSLDTGAAAIGNSGQVAASALQAGAASAGATLGSTALGIIQGAHINVNVNVSGAGGASKGNPGPATAVE